MATLAGSYSAPLKLSIVDDNVRVLGATVIGDFDGIYDLNGRDVTGANGHLSPGVYIVSTPNCTSKVVIK